MAYGGHTLPRLRAPATVDMQHSYGDVLAAYALQRALRRNDGGFNGAAGSGQQQATTTAWYRAGDASHHGCTPLCAPSERLSRPLRQRQRRHGAWLPPVRTAVGVAGAMIALLEAEFVERWWRRLFGGGTADDQDSGTDNDGERDDDGDGKLRRELDKCVRSRHHFAYWELAVARATVRVIMRAFPSSSSSSSSSLLSARGAAGVRALACAFRAARGVLVVALFRAAERALDKVTRPFPGSLVGLGALTLLLKAADAVAPGHGPRDGGGGGSGSEWVADFCRPATAFLQEWMPLFFAPPLVTVPLLPGKFGGGGGGGGQRVLIKAVLIVVSGFLLSLTSTARVTEALRCRRRRQQRPRRQNGAAVGGTEAAEQRDGDSRDHVDDDERRQARDGGADDASAASTRRESDAIQFVLGLLTAVWCASRPSRARDTALLVAVSALSFRVGVKRVPPRVHAVLHPVLTCAGCTALVAATLERAHHHEDHEATTSVSPSWRDKLAAYNGASSSSSSSPPAPGAYLMRALGPSLISLAFRLHQVRGMLAEHSRCVLGGSAFATAVSLAFSALASRALRMQPPAVRDAMLPRSITSPLALSAVRTLRADESVAMAAVVLSGLLGANFGRWVLRWSAPPSSTSAIARGVAMGGAAHGLGTAALVTGGESPAASAASAVALGVVGALTTAVVSALALVPRRRL